METNQITLKWLPKAKLWLIEGVRKNCPAGVMALNRESLKGLSKGIARAIRDGNRGRIKPIFVGNISMEPAKADADSNCSKPRQKIDSAAWTQVMAAFEKAVGMLRREIEILTRDSACAKGKKKAARRSKKA